MIKKLGITKAQKKTSTQKMRKFFAGGTPIFPLFKKKLVCFLEPMGNTKKCAKYSGFSFALSILLVVLRCHVFLLVVVPCHMFLHVVLLHVASMPPLWPDESD